jgi:3-deoxy-D-manno-octulosonic-acid transferase
MAPTIKTIPVYLYQWFLDCLYPILRLLTFAKRGSFRERLGFYDSETIKPLASGENVWLHAASAGEVNAILPFSRALREKYPKTKLILTTTSQTGKKLALEKNAADMVFLAPLDMTRPLRRAFQAFRPALILIAETEIWPNWFFRAVQNQVPLLWINGRISNKSFPSYRRLKALFGPALRCFNQCLVQTKLDVEKLAALGVDEKRVQVMGQMKYDLKAPDDLKAREWGSALGFQPGDEIATLGSLREGEEEAWIAEIPALLERRPRLKLILAPRHIKNAGLYQSKLAEVKVESSLRSLITEKTASPPARVLVLDTVGELSLAYHLSKAAFVGGTLVPIGGHNVMEPALSAVPVLFGPHTQNVSEAAEVLLAQGGGFQASSAGDLAPLLEKLLDPAQSKIAGEKARQAVDSLAGATAKSLKAVSAYLP